MSPQFRRKMQHNPYIDYFPQTGLEPYTAPKETMPVTNKSRIIGPKVPQRTTKTAQKLVLLPPSYQHISSAQIPASIEAEIQAAESVTLTGDDEIARTIAERMSKEQRFLFPRGFLFIYPCNQSDFV